VEYDGPIRLRRPALSGSSLLQASKLVPLNRVVDTLFLCIRLPSSCNSSQIVSETCLGDTSKTANRPCRCGYTLPGTSAVAPKIHSHNCFRLHISLKRIHVTRNPASGVRCTLTLSPSTTVTRVAVTAALTRSPAAQPMPRWRGNVVQPLPVVRQRSFHLSATKLRVVRFLTTA
jgi:hypothetical protein